MLTSGVGDSNRYPIPIYRLSSHDSRVSRRRTIRHWRSPSLYHGDMTMGRRRLVLAIGAAVLVGGWGATWTFSNPPWRIVGVAGVVSMAVGAGLMGFAALQGRRGNDGKADG